MLIAAAMPDFRQTLANCLPTGPILDAEIVYSIDRNGPNSSTPIRPSAAVDEQTAQFLQKAAAAMIIRSLVQGGSQIEQGLRIVVVPVT